MGFSSSSTSTSSSSTPSKARSWIRGVNLGGWLLAERFITPYLFALNTCQRNGDWCFYPGQLSAPSGKKYEICDLYHCEPHQLDLTHDYPTDEYTLFQSFDSKSLAKEYMTFHWDNFVTKADIQALQNAGVTHIRVPVPHYIMGDILPTEPWIDGQWLYFVRLVGWARQYGLEVWIDLHTASGSQNGFDNSGHMLETATCQHWISSDANINRTIQVIRDISTAVMKDNLRDVVTGFGILNEPYMDCDIDKVKQFNNDAFQTVRTILGPNAAVYMADSFNATQWNTGSWWTDPTIYNNTYLDSHYYHVFAEHERALNPKQHVAYTCAKLSRETASCCYQDPPHDTKVSQGISRIVGEWSAAFDTLPTERLNEIMSSIAKNGEAVQMSRELSRERRTFLKQLVQAQMVTYENVQSGVSSGWFYWTLKMEGGAFAEWDFLRGVTEGWIPQLPEPHVNSETQFGTCHEIAEATSDDRSIVHEFPDPQTSNTWPGPPIDDDYVVSLPNAKSSDKLKPKTRADSTSSEQSTDKTESKPVPTGSKSKSSSSGWRWFRFFALCFFCYGIWQVFLKNEYGFGRSRTDYTPLTTATHLNI
ncbi:exo-1,3-beta-glucosidase [Nitzschia inconspicua]|uniref:glucan 1,3-beta-glucosidase n=1 Tax=Nitzschia inconspicua TaxID=303405 RepID=A0A9K3LN05_9STRA|nr:exo-1,3-beta-glucosidase [Nitzschia inconspicua]